MKQHFLPVFYLKGFTDPDTPAGHEPHLWLHSAADQNWKKASPRRVAALPEYYTVKGNDGTKDREVENILSELESTASRILTKIYDRKNMTPDERITIALFVMFMKSRVPAEHEHLGESIAEIGTKTLAVMHKAFTEDPRRFEAYKKRYRRDTGRADIDDMTIDDLDPSHGKVQTKRTYSIALALSTATDMVPILASMGWTFIMGKPPDYFITSDYPFCMADLTQPQSSYYGVGFANQEVEVSLPLSKQCALVARWGDDECSWLYVDRAVVEQINFRTTKYAQRYLFAPKTDFPGSQKLKSATHLDHE